MTEGSSISSFPNSSRLLLTMVEQMKLPFMHISHTAQLLSLADNPDAATIQVAADTALRLLDGYLLGLYLTEEGVPPTELEAVSIAAILYDVAERISSFARSYGVTLDICIDGKQGPVVTYKRGLLTALLSLGYAFIEALPAHGAGLTLRLAAHRSSHGIVAGVYSETECITARSLEQGRTLYGRARQPLNNFSHTPGAGIFVADTIFEGMRTHLKISRYKRWLGVATTLQPHIQLQLV